MELKYETVLPLFAGAWILYSVLLALYRLRFSPIAHIPGPKLAAVTQFYEFYYDIILGGQFTFKIIQLHRQYGAVVRINPWEVHVAEHDFHSELYCSSARRREKWSFWTKQVRQPNQLDFL